VKIIILGAGQVAAPRAYHLFSRRKRTTSPSSDTTNGDPARPAGPARHPDRERNASSPRILEAAGIAGTDILVALTNSDEVNMLACQIAWTLFRTPKKIARVRSADYTARSTAVRRERGRRGRLDQSGAAGHGIRRPADPLPRRTAVLDFADGRVRLVGIRARAREALGGAARTAREHIPTADARVAAIYRRAGASSAEGDTVIEDATRDSPRGAQDIRAVMKEMRREEAPGGAW